MTRKRRRLYIVLAGLVSLGVATGLVLLALGPNLSVFYSPTELLKAEHDVGARRIRIGGLVEAHSVVRDGTTTTFEVTDTTNRLKVTYTGLLPDLFREGQGVMASGHLAPNGTFVADQILAKHDEKYMPPEVAAELKKQGHWEPETVSK
ncbi:MAG TPA: cytochrome c maturation protein CcmE [Candidatus Sulfotelmatobacter sp.]|nr:cytochrome c maturation protein CcmE [Candidatus Sulfotelmatobacter sp.]